MLRALVKKELRELLPLIAVAVLVEIYVVCLATGKQLGALSGISNFIVDSYRDSLPFTYGDGYSDVIAVVAGALAIAMGLWQTLWEINRGTFLYLLHRPTSRNRIVGAKLSVGILTSLIVGGTAMLLYAFWAAAPGAFAGPFRWSMTARSWLLVALLPLGYLARILSGLRNARWFGSRSFPLFTCMLLGVGVNYFSASLPGIEILLLVVVLIVEGLYGYLILQFARSTDFS